MYCDSCSDHPSRLAHPSAYPAPLNHQRAAERGRLRGRVAARRRRPTRAGCGNFDIISGPISARFSAPPRPKRAVHRAPCFAPYPYRPEADWSLESNPMLGPISGNLVQAPRVSAP